MSDLPPRDPNDFNIDLGDVEARDFRSRLPRSESSPDESISRDSGAERINDDYGDDDGADGSSRRRTTDGGTEPEGCLKFGIRGSEFFFLLVLLVAGLRGGDDTRGCLPSRQCLNAAGAIIGGTLLFVGGIYYAAQGGSEQLALAAACIGSVVCLGGGGGVIFLLLGIMRAIDFTPGNSLDDGSLMDGILGGLGGRR